MRRKCKFTFLVAVLLLSAALNANSQVYKQLTISSGVGFSNMYLFLGQNQRISLLSETFLEGTLYSYGPPFRRYPVINTIVEYGVDKKNSLGLTFAYQQINNYPYSYLLLVGDLISPNAAEKVSRTNIAFRYLHYIKGKGTFYYGLRVGFSFWRDRTPQGMNETYSLFGKPSYTLPAMQFLFGYRYYFIYNVAINIEAALGSPYYANAGITVRLGKHTAKKK